ncbi:MAG: DNRLRE domain-containing protein [Ignavibacteriales bacterium]|nr:DNRLRE domain-containing protein [Ignavibacteriales bacterium]
MKNLTVCFPFLFALCLFSASAKAQVVLDPIKDQYVQQSITTPFTLTSADSLLRVRASASGSTTVNRNSYVRYDVSKVKGTLTKAELSMTVQLAANNATPVVPDRADIHAVDDTWDPATLIWTNQPTAGALLASVEGVVPVKAADFPKPVFKADVTNYVRGKLSSSASVISFVLSDDKLSGADLRLYSSRCTRSMGQLPIELILTGVTTGVEDVENQIPTTFSVSQNYPNPFNPSTMIQYQLPKAATVSLKVFNTLGEEVSVLVNEYKEAGAYQARWNANAPSGVYFYRFQAGGYVETKKMMLLR